MGRKTLKTANARSKHSLVESFGNVLASTTCYLYNFKYSPKVCLAIISFMLFLIVQLTDECSVIVFRCDHYRLDSLTFTTLDAEMIK